MKLSVRTKLIVLLIVVALLPLVAAVSTIAIGWQRLRSQTIGQDLLAIGRSEVLARQIALSKDAETLLVLLRAPEVMALLRSKSVALPPEELRRLDQEWPREPAADPRIQAALNNPVTELLREFTRDDPRFKAIILTDRFGQNVAAVGRKGDFYQADESWWQQTYDGGKGRIFIPQISFDEDTGAWSVAFCVPVMYEGKVIGIAKAVLDASEWMTLATGIPSSRMLEIEHQNVGLMLVGSDGSIIHRDKIRPFSQRLEDWSGEIAEGKSPGWRLTHQELQAYMPVSLPSRIGNLPVEAPKWVLVIYESRTIVFDRVYKVSLVSLFEGLIVVLLLFVLGLFVFEHGIVRRLLRLRDAAKHVSQGDLTFRISAERSPHVADEIDQLIAGFNQMIDHVEKSTQALQAANQLKSDFIRIAGHELRTPVSYILGMTRLLRDSNDPTRMLFAIQSMGAKAKRLNEIIQAMFKLMPSQFRGEDMQFSRVNLSELLEEVYVDIFPFVEQRNQRLIVEEFEKAPPVQADRDKIRDVIENLLMNAIKFTPDGGIIKIRASRQLGERVMVSVQDQGPGIPEGEYPRLFQPFYGGTDVMTHSTGESGYQKRGIGLGLAIVRHFVELHHGTVHVSSSPLGSTFSFTIPIEPPPV
jgi:signal transduction histidine kinase